MVSNRMQVGLSLGLSFAELCAIDLPGDNPLPKKAPVILATGRCYLPQVSLKEFFKRHLLPLDPKIPFEIRVSLRALEKIFGTRLGGSVAQLTTKGFESWFYSRPMAAPTGLGPEFKKKDFLGEPDLVFPVNERIDGQGRVITALDPTELTVLAEKLKKRDIKKICINFINSHLNPTHAQSAMSFLKELEFEVFCYARPGVSSDEISSWRTNILNACLSGTFNEIDRDLKAAACEVFPELFADVEAVPVVYLNSEGSFEKTSPQNLIGILMGWTSLLPNHSSLNLGLEKWCYSSGKIETTWKSPWGDVEVSHRSFKNLSLQLTSLAEVQPHDEIAWGDEVGFEPGPISFGRSAKYCLFDFLSYKIPSVRELMNPIVNMCEPEKLLEPLHLLQKTSRNPKFADYFYQQILNSLLLQCPVDDLQVDGFWSLALENSLRVQFPNMNLRFPSSEYSEVFRVASLDSFDATSL